MTGDGGRVVLDWSCGELAEGLACYCSGQFFEAHEHWELVWLRLEDPEKSFLQAIIQITAAFHHWQKREVAGTSSLLRRVQRRLALCPAVFGGIAVAQLREEIAAWLKGIESGSVPAEVPRICPADAAGNAPSL